MSQAPDRRQRARVNLPGGLRGPVGPARDVRVLNLSPSGAMIEHTGRFPPGQPCTLALRLAEVDLRLRARVVWSRLYTVRTSPPGEEEVRFRSGLQFLDVPGSADAHIRHYLATPRAPKVGPTHGLA